MLDIYQIDAFTNSIFGGNPACVVPLPSWLPDEILLKITQENAVAETAFFVPKGDRFHLRWFTPEIEMDLCGHATLATAHCLKTILKYPSNNIVFETVSGNLSVAVKDGFYFLDFPSRIPVPAALPELIEKSLNIPPKEVYKSRDYVLVYDTEQEVKNIKSNSLHKRLKELILKPNVYGLTFTSLIISCIFIPQLVISRSIVDVNEINDFVTYGIIEDL